VRRTFLSPYGKYRKLAYAPLIMMLVLFGYAAFTVLHSGYQIANRDPYGTPVSADSPKIISESHTSPDNAYAIKEVLNPPIQIIFEVHDKEGNTIRTLAYENNKEIDGDRDVHGCDCKVSFKGWINNHTFAIKTIKEDGTEYEVIIDIKKYYK
jgi:hypothetical protein